MAHLVFAAPNWSHRHVLRLGDLLVNVCTTSEESPFEIHVRNDSGEAVVERIYAAHPVTQSIMRVSFPTGAVKETGFYADPPAERLPRAAE